MSIVAGCIYLVNSIKAHEEKIITTKIIIPFSEKSLLFETTYHDKIYIKSIDQRSQYSIFISNSEPLDVINEHAKGDFGNGTTFVGKEIYDTLIINSIAVNFSHFAINKTFSSDYRKYFDLLPLGLPFKFINKSHSLIHSLKEQNRIDRRAYGFGNFSLLEGSLYLGGIPEEITKNKRKISLNVNKNSICWETQISYAFLSLEKYYVCHNEKIVFQSGTDSVFVPKKFYDFLNKTVFESYLVPEFLQKNICYYRFTKVLTFVCRSGGFLKFDFPTVELIIDGKVIFLDLNSLIYYFNDEENIWTHEIMISPNYNDTNEWVLGRQFLVKIDSEFDFDEEKINIYTHKMDNKKSFFRIYNLRKLLKIISGIDIIASFLIILLKFY